MRGCELQFTPPKGIRGPHPQTLWGYLVAESPRIRYRRELLENPKGDSLALDWYDYRTDGPLVIVQHGLEGSSKAPYVRRLADQASRMGMSGCPECPGVWWQSK